MHKTTKNIINTTLATIITLGVLELYQRYEYRQHDDNIENGLHIYYHAAFANICKPGTSGRSKTSEYDVSLTANDIGFRDSGERGDIHVIGDSYTWGTGVEESERYTDILERKLDMPVWNLGLCSGGTLTEAAVYSIFSRPHKPKTVVLQFFANDIQNNVWRIREFIANKGDVGRTITTLLKYKALWPGKDRIIGNDYEPSALLYYAKKQLDRKPMHPIEKITHGDNHLSASWTGTTHNVQMGWNITYASLSYIQARCKVDGTKLIVLYIPQKDEIHEGEFEDTLKQTRVPMPANAFDLRRPIRILFEMCKKLNIPLVIPQGEGNDLYFKIDQHLTPKGHEWIADHLIGSLLLWGHTGYNATNAPRTEVVGPSNYVEVVKSTNIIEETK